MLVMRIGTEVICPAWKLRPARLIGSKSEYAFSENTRMFI